jgi:hypothetical protein
MSFTIQTNAFNDGGVIPAQYTCDGNNSSPFLEWHSPPTGTKSYVLLVDDYDAPNGLWNHWIVYNLPSNVNKLTEGIKILPEPAQHGENTWHRQEYGGPCPPDKEHRYYFKLFALDDMLNPQHKVTRENIDNIMEQHILGQTMLMGRYDRIRQNR